MNPERFERISELFLEARRMEPGARTGFLERACDGDADLLEQVRMLLTADADPLVTEGGATLVASLGGAAGTGAAPDRIGPFEIRGVLGAGGMGVVYEASQERPRRSVALKVLRSGLVSDDARRRFAFEIEVLGKLSHPGIAAIFDAGVEESAAGDRMWFAMERIEGAPLDRWLDKHALPRDTPESIRLRVALFVEICDAVAHAHQKGVIHRDLKPANILVDGDRHARVVDFGIARVTDAELIGTFLETAEGRIAGTLAYMSPEQASVGGRDLDTRTDVYSLGVILYEILAGVHPYPMGDLPITAALQQIVERDSPRLGTIHRRLSGDLENIVQMALSKDRTRRYASAAELGADLRRYLDDEAVIARPATATYLFSRFVRKHRGLVAGAAIALLALVVALAVSVHFLVESRRALSVKSGVVTFLEAMLLTPSENAEEGAVSLAAALERAGEHPDLERLSDEARGEVEAMLGSSFLGLSRFEEAVRHLREGRRRLAAAGRERGKAHALATSLLANALASSGELEEASEFARAGVEAMEAAADAGPGDALDARHTRMLVLLRAADYEEVLAEAQRVLARIDEIADPPRRAALAADVHRGMGGALMRLGRFDESVEVTAQAVAIRKEAGVPLSGEDFNDLLGLAGSLASAGRLRDALPVAVDALDLARRVFGDESLKTATALSHVAVMTLMSGDLETAGPYFEESYEAARAVEESADPGRLAHLVGDYGRYLKYVGRIDESIALMKESIELAERANPEPNDDLTTRLQALGSVLLEVERPEEALPVLERSYQVSKAAAGERHVETLRSLKLVSRAQVALGEEARGLALLSEVVAILGEDRGETDHDTMNAALELGFRLAKSDDPQRLERALQVLEPGALHGAEALGDREPVIRHELEYGATLARLNREAEARAVLDRAQARLDRVGRAGLEAIAERLEHERAALESGE